MSTDLQLRRDLPRIRVPPVKIDDPPMQSCTPGTEETDSTVIHQERRDSEGCRTPTSEEHKIPPILSCPPAPRKPRRMSSCKRKLLELGFFENVNREEVESFFRSSFEVVAKRRCSCA